MAGRVRAVANRKAMRTRLVLLVCGTSLLAGLAGPAAAATPRTLTVRGERNTFADVTFTTRIRLSTSTSSKTPPRYATSGSYAAVFVEPLGRVGAGAGTVLLNGLPGWEDVPFPLAPPGDWLAPGRYRVHFMSDAPGAVRIAVEGLRRDLTVVTARRSPVSGGFLDRDVAGVAPVADRTVVPLDIRPNTLTIVASVHRSTAVYGRRDVCVRSGTNALSPCLEGNGGRGWYWGVTPIEWTIGGAAVYSPGELPTGPAEVEFLDATVGVPDEVYRFVLTLN